MSYDTSNLKNNKGGATLEVPEQEVTPAGLYRHEETGQEIITTSHPLFGNAQSEGLVRVGFKFVRESEPGEIKTIVEQILDQKSESQTDIASLVSRLKTLEASKETASAEKDELAELREYKRLKDLEESDDAGTSKVDAVEAGEKQGADLAKNAETQKSSEKKETK